MDGLRVLIVADDPLSRGGLAALLGGEQGCAVVGQAGLEAGLDSLVETYRPDVVLCDLGWDPALALDALTDLAEADAPVLALLPDAGYGPQAWAAGARGLLLRRVDGARLGASLAAVARGAVALDPEMVGAMLAGQGRTVAGQLPEVLTPREVEVLRLVAEGLPNKAIAQRLGIAERTVKFHVNAILGKLGAQSRTEAVVQATRLGLVPL